MNMQIALLAVIGLAIAANCGVKAEELRNPAHFVMDEKHDLEAMQEHTLELSEKLEAELPDNKDPEANIEAAKRMLRKLGSALMGKKKVKKQTLELLVSLKDAANKCDKAAMKTLGRGYIVFPEHRVETRARQVFLYYIAKHAELCRPQYKQKFDEQVSKVSKDDFYKLKQSVAKLVSGQFACGYRHVDPAGLFRSDKPAYAMGKDSFVAECSHRARVQLTRNALDLWRSLEPEAALAAKSNGRILVPASVYDEYLFKPCKNLVDQMGDLLTLARFVAVSEDAGQKSYIHGDEAFRDAMGFNVVCESLVKEKSKLQKLLGENVIHFLGES